jgi:ABC-type transport system involved in cytochrome bd biosynthesis fused ATPase/permease subunit
MGAMMRQATKTLEQIAGALVTTIILALIMPVAALALTLALVTEILILPFKVMRLGMERLKMRNLKDG